MTSNDLNYDDREEPQRDRRGRFRKGMSGNPNGRPPKPPAVPLSYERSFKVALGEVVPVTGLDGTVQLLTMRDLIIKTCIRNAVKAKPKDQLAMLERLARLSVLFPTEEEAEPNKDILLEEHRRILEMIERDFPELQ